MQTQPIQSEADLQDAFKRLAPIFQSEEGTPEYAAMQVPGALHGDPADRLIAATARHLDAVLVTADGKLLAYGAAGHLRVLAAT